MVQGFGEPTKTAFVRLKREGDKVVTGWSLDGKKWKDFKYENKVNWGAKVKVGVVAENCLEVPVEITFDQYSLTQPKQ
jgi:regulation of enolase protein 1 (concanavalin A-like superfamily)